MQHLQEGEEAEEKNPIETKEPGEGEFLFPIGKDSADDEESGAKIRVVGDQKFLHGGDSGGKIAGIAWDVVGIRDKG